MVEEEEFISVLSFEVKEEVGLEFPSGEGAEKKVLGDMWVLELGVEWA